MSTIKINNNEYNFKHKIEDISLDLYFQILDILRKEEYETYLDKDGVEHNRKEPLEQRTSDFIKGLYIEIMQKLSNIPFELISQDDILEYLISLLSESLTEIQKLEQYSDDDIKSFVYYYDNKSYMLKPFEDWTFYQFVCLEMFTKNENRYIIPICLNHKGVFDPKMRYINKSFDIFNNIMDIRKSLPLYLYLYQMIINIKEAHPYIYNPDDSNSDIGKNAIEHSETFGFLDTIRSLSELGVFGTYLQTKEAPLFEVLEYLNTSISYNMAETNDYKLKNKI